MVEPTILPRSAHTISRRDIDPDALKVLYKLHEHNYIAYLVGGSVRDLLLRRRPKDFDVGTSAHPHQIKKLFRNCWIIGRRFRLAHVKFGAKTIEVATFRRQVEPAELTVEAETQVPRPDEVVPPEESLPSDNGGTTRRRRRGGDHFIHRDNTYGTPEEDAFRRDFTVNALFYDIGTFAIIDYVGGLADLDARVIRSIGDPDVRFLEDPVRMLRAVVLASRLQFTIDPRILESIAAHRHEIARSAPARLLEEYYKILRSGHAQEAMRQLVATRLMKEIAPELATESEALWRSIARVDVYRSQFETAPDALTNAILAGTLLHPLGLAGRRQRFSADPLERRVELGMLPIARRDIERLHQIIALQPRLTDTQAPLRVQRGLLHRSAFKEALTWLDIHGDRPDVVAYWRQLQTEAAAYRAAHTHDELSPFPFRPAGRRRRRRRRSRFASPE